ncbi:MAG TPA: hypothetical protein PK514_03795 [Spirochaetota bacterium]|nr:hypothetical protein [Spirochaetota bacterium]
MFMVLILFAPAVQALPLTRTLYIAPPDVVDFTVSCDYLYTSRQITRERFSVCTGLWNGAALSAHFDLLGDGVLGRDTPGDSLIEFVTTIDSLSSGDLRTAFYCSVLMPSGPDASITEYYRGAAFGKNEISAGPVLACDFTGNLAGFFNLFYSFRQGQSGGFYSGFRIDPADRETYKSVLGLNPFYRDSFMYYKKLSDDYVSIASAAVYSGLFPVVAFTELRCSVTIRRFYGGDVSDAEGSGVNPFMASLGAKYFVMDSFYAQVYGSVNPLMSNDGVRWQSGILLNLIF